MSKFTVRTIHGKEESSFGTHRWGELIGISGDRLEWESTKIGRKAGDVQVVGHTDRPTERDAQIIVDDDLVAAETDVERLRGD